MGPNATLGKAVSEVKPGQTIYLRGGTYRADQAGGHPRCAVAPPTSRSR